MSALAFDPEPAAHLLDRLLRNRSDRAALVTSDGTLSYAQLAAGVDGHAAWLAASGVDVGSIVAFDSVRDADTIALLLAIVHRGAAYLPLDPSLPMQRRTQMIEDARPNLIVAANEASHRDDAVAPLAGELAYVLFTSGSTGRPKGVAMRSNAVRRLIEWHVAHARLGKPARTLQFAPLSFDVSFQEIFSTLATGGTLIVANDAQRRDPWTLLELIERERIERVFLPYVALQSLADAAAGNGRGMTALDDVIIAGEQLRITPAIRALFTAMPNAVLHNHYGPTETHVVTAHELSGDRARWPELPPIGAPLPHAVARISDDDTDEGELLLGGDCLARDYINRTELTEERFVYIDGTRWYRTGDRVRRDSHGGFEYIGRVDEQVKLAGHRIEPAEIEAVLSRHADVVQSAVVAVGVANEKRLVAHVVPREGSSLHESTDSLRALCERSLPDYMVPQEFVLHALLPMTSSGKIDRRSLAQNADAPALHWNDEAPLAEQISQLWRQLLGVARLDATANLFDLGARSLTVVHALTELRRRGHVLSVAQMYEYPTVAAQATLLDAPGDQDMVRGDRRGQRQRAAFARFARGGGA